MKHKVMKKLLATILSVVLGVTVLPVGEVNAATTKLSNPKIKKDSSMESGQVVTYDCVWFGSYPQAEVVPSKKDYNALKSDYLKDGDLIEDSTLYNELKALKGWDKNGDITYKENKYCRIKSGDATMVNSSYTWSDTTSYHYFKYQPIKWRVLSVENGEAFLLSDIGLDDKKYNDKDGYVTWETCSLRSWLNDDFKNRAFSKEEQQGILTENVANADNKWYENKGGNDTKDDIFLLAEEDVSATVNSLKYGFLYEQSGDEARRFQSSTYAKAMGTYCFEEYKGCASVWLRSPGADNFGAEVLEYYGWVYEYGYDGDCLFLAVCPALKLDLSASKLYSYAGTVSTNGTKEEFAQGETVAPSKNTKLTTKNTTIKLSKTSYTYDGKAKKPSVKVYNKKGKVLDKKYYTVSYKNNKKVGKATLTIKFKEKYSGTIKATYTIKPKATKITGAKKNAKNITVTWKKQSTQITGYQVQIATDKKYTKDKKTYTIAKPKQTSMNIKGLKNNKQYYFRIRTYKTVNGKKYYSAWSKNTILTVK